MYPLPKILVLLETLYQKKQLLFTTFFLKVRPLGSTTWNCFESGDFKGDYSKQKSISALSLNTPVISKKLSIEWA